MNKDYIAWKNYKSVYSRIVIQYCRLLETYNLVSAELLLTNSEEYRKTIQDRVDQIAKEIHIHDITLQQMDEELNIQELVYFCNHNIYPEDVK